MINNIKSKYVLSVKCKLLCYFAILCKGDYPYFIDEYIDTIIMQRLKGIGQFCSCDYQKIDAIIPKEWFTRLDHSIANALMAWRFTHNKTVTIAALFHDLGTPAFSHCVDFLLNDSVKQESSERDIFYTISSSSTITKLLARDGVFLGDVCKPKKYSIIENTKPLLCTDRLEGVFHTGLFWLGFWDLPDIDKIYSDMGVILNETGRQEIGFRNTFMAEKFYEGVYKYSMILQKNEDKLVLKFMGDILKLAIHYKVIQLDDLYIYSEAEIIEKIKNSDISLLEDCWDLFTKLDHVKRSGIEIKNKYCRLVNSSPRHTMPLCFNNGKPKRLDDLSDRTKSLKSKYENFHDSTYAYLDNSEGIQKKLSILNLS